MIASAPSPRTSRDRALALRSLAERAASADFDRQGRILYFVDQLSPADQLEFETWFGSILDDMLVS